MIQKYIAMLCKSTLNTIVVYVPSWLSGCVLGLVLSCVIWHLSPKNSSRAYFILTGISFVPVTILLPYFIRFFGLKVFVYPLLALPVLLITFASSFEAFQHTNRHRLTLLKNYRMKRLEYFWKVVFRESLPIMNTTARQTLSLSFAIFLAIDYFIEYWGGLGALAQKYYGRLGFDSTNHIFLLSIIVFASMIGMLQVFINNHLFKRWVEFRKHY